MSDERDKDRVPGDPAPAGPKLPNGLKVPPKPLRPETYEALWASYRDGTRSVVILKKRHVLGSVRVRWAIDRGWPEANQPALAARAEWWDKQKDQERQRATAEADRKAAEEKGREEAESWASFAPKATSLAMKGLAMLNGVTESLQRAIPAASFVRYRRVNGRDEAYVDGVIVSTAVRNWAAAFKDVGNLVAFLTDKGEVDRIPELTAAQLEDVAAGRVPQGMTLEQTVQAAMAKIKGTGT
jgi:hypothetical protein